MDKRSKIGFAAIGAFGLFAGAASAAIDHKKGDGDHDHDEDYARAQEAHVHGAWALFAALDEDQLSVTVKGPIVDVLGFERRPSTEDELKSIAAFENQIADPGAFFTLSDRAGCVAAAAPEIVLPEGFSTSNDPDEEDDHDHHDGDGHDHDDDEHHDDHDHDDHDHDGDEHDDHEPHHDDHDAGDDHDDGHNDGHGGDHNDVDVSYVFTCEKPSRLRAITVTGFDAYPAIAG